ncbi:MAG: hypothetical protein WEA61_05900 [Anaerolineales bacterium]
MENRHIGSLVGGLLLVGFGLLALLAQLVQGWDFWGTYWPFIIIGFGALFFVIMLASGKSAAPLAIPGSIFAGIGLVLFLQVLTGHWASWAYGWTLILVMVGVGIYIMGMWSNEEDHHDAGRRVMGIGLMMFILFGAFFEMIFNSMPFAQLVFPIALIVLGGYLIVTRLVLARSQKVDKVIEERPIKKAKKGTKK